MSTELLYLSISTVIPPSLGGPMPPAPVHELRLVLAVDDFDSMVGVFRDVLGMREVPAVGSPGGRVAILEADTATLELADAGHAAYIDEVEVGPRSAGQVRIALGVAAVAECSRRLADAGLVRLAPPTVTPFGSTKLAVRTASRSPAHALRLRVR
jgi:hypothetical protein